MSGTLELGGRKRGGFGDRVVRPRIRTGGLPADLAGWDWFSVQLSDGTELMLYRLRTGGRESPYSQGTFIGKDGVAPFPHAADFEVAATGTWKSPGPARTIRSGWRIGCPPDVIRPGGSRRRSPTRNS